MEIPIWVYNRDEVSKQELTGKSGPNTRKATLHINTEDIIGFWIDVEVDDETGTRDIVFYVGSISFRTPWSEIKEVWFKDTISKRELKKSE